jgi:hypothetical protein
VGLGFLGAVGWASVVAEGVGEDDYFEDGDDGLLYTLSVLPLIFHGKTTGTYHHPVETPPLPPQP